MQVWIMYMDTCNMLNCNVTFFNFYRITRIIVLDNSNFFTGLFIFELTEFNCTLIANSYIVIVTIFTKWLQDKKKLIICTFIYCKISNYSFFGFGVWLIRLVSDLTPFRWTQHLVNETVIEAFNATTKQLNSRA